MGLQPTILLIGLRGSGKSTLGRQLADRMGLGFEDLDAVTLSAMGYATVSEAWDAEGEPAFRAAEAESLRVSIERMRNAGGVLALGGGTPMIPGAPEIISGSGAATVYLRAEPGLLRDRLAGGAGADRPSLTGQDPIDEIERVFNDRDDRYRGIASQVLQLRAHEEPEETLGRLAGLINA